MRQALALVGPESLVICLGRSRGLGGLVASTSHSQPRFSPSHLPALIHTPPPLALSCLFMHPLPIHLGPCPCLCLPYCPLVVSLPLPLSHPSLLCLAFLSLTVPDSSYLLSTHLPTLSLPISAPLPFLVLSALLSCSGLSLGFLLIPLYLASLFQA